MTLAGCNSTRNCGTTCVRPDLIPARLHRIASLDWRKIDRDVFHREWPEAPVPPVSLGPPQSRGTKDLERDIACCCKAGQGLVAAGFDYPLAETPTAEAPGLWGVEVIVCGPIRKQTVDALKALVDAVVPEHPKSAPTNWGPSGGAGATAVWDAGGERLVLDAFVQPRQGGWLGWFELHRRAPLRAVETWTLEDGSQVRILRLEIESSGNPPEKILRLDYLSECPFDHSCWSKEITAFWPRLRARAEREGIRKVDLGVSSGVGAYEGFRVVRGADGKWDGPPF
jgi:hypothetical protein